MMNSEVKKTKRKETQRGRKKKKTRKGGRVSHSNNAQIVNRILNKLKREGKLQSTPHTGQKIDTQPSGRLNSTERRRRNKLKKKLNKRR